MGVRIEKFKRFDQVDLAIDDVTLLIGGNNSGKSSVLQAIHFFTALAQTAGPSRSGRGSTTVLPADLYYAPAEEVMNLRHGERLSQKLGIGIHYAIEYPDDRATRAINVVRGKNANLSIKFSDAGFWETLSSLDEPFSMYVPGLAGIADNEAYLSPRIVQRAATRGHGNAVLRNVLLRLKTRTAQWDEFLARLHRVYPGEVIEVDFAYETDEVIAAVVVTDSGRTPLALAGTGLLQTAQVLAYMLLYQPHLLLLDEPDAHLHPSRQISLVREVSDWARNNSSRVLIATHSRHIVTALEGEALVHWMRAGELADPNESSLAAMLLDMGALDRIDKAAAGAASGIVISEDAKSADGTSATNALPALLEANGASVDRIVFLNYGGSGNFDGAAQLARLCRQIYPELPVLIHRDRDYHTDEEVQQLINAGSSDGITTFVTTGTDIESHFLSITHLMSVAQAIPEGELEAMRDAAIAGARKASLDKWSRTDELRSRKRPQSGSPSPHQLAHDRVVHFDEDPLKYVYGKQAAKSLRHELRQKSGGTVELFSVTSALENPLLKEWATQLT